MNHTLVTFLGRTRRDPNTGYQRARYRFPGEDAPRETPFFGIALAGHLQPDGAVILGTSGSQWSVLVEHLAPGDEVEAARLELLDAETHSTIAQPMLDAVAPLMSGAVGLPVTPRLIPSGRDADEQYEILGAVAETVANGEVTFDLTHGFRHLGMVGFLSAFMLERVRNLRVRGLWYGALDMTDSSGVTPVLRLDGLVRVRRWVDALDRFDATGDYGVFAPLLVEDGVADDKAGCLTRAAFFERTQNLSDAAHQLRTFLPILDTPLPGATGLFQTRLAERLRWVKAGDPAQHQRRLAFEHLKRGDYLRAAVFGWEALCTVECERRRLPPGDYDTGRKPAIDCLAAELRAGEHPERKKSAFLLLRDVRNALAHGSPPRSRHSQQVVQNPDRLRSELEKAFQRLLQKER